MPGAVFEVAGAAFGVGLRLEHVFAGLEMKGHDLEQALGAGMADDCGMTAGFDLHDGGQQLGIDIVLPRPLIDLARPVAQGRREE